MSRPWPDWEHLKLKSLLCEARDHLLLADHIQITNYEETTKRQTHLRGILRTWTSHQITLAPYRATTATTMSQFVGKVHIDHARLLPRTFL